MTAEPFRPEKPELNEPARLPRPAATPGRRRTGPPGPARDPPPRRPFTARCATACSPAENGSGRSSASRRRAQSPDCPAGVDACGLLARTDPHLLADSRRSAGARQRRLSAGEADQPQSVRRRHGDPGRRCAADAGVPGAGAVGDRPRRDRVVPGRGTGHGRGNGRRDDRRTGGGPRRRGQAARRGTARNDPPRQDRRPAASQRADGRDLRRSRRARSMRRYPGTASMSAWRSRSWTTFSTSRSPPKRSGKRRARTRSSRRSRSRRSTVSRRRGGWRKQECARAHEVLEPFADRAVRLHELADLIVHRKS